MLEFNEISYNDLLKLENDVQGVYLLINDIELIYIGKSIKIKERTIVHNRHGVWGQEEHFFDKILYIKTKDEFTTSIIECYLINMFYPKLNDSDKMQFRGNVLLIPKEYVNIAFKKVNNTIEPILEDWGI